MNPNFCYEFPVSSSEFTDIPEGELASVTFTHYDVALTFTNGEVVILKGCCSTSKVTLYAHTDLTWVMLSRIRGITIDHTVCDDGYTRYTKFTIHGEFGCSEVMFGSCGTNEAKKAADAYRGPRT